MLSVLKTITVRCIVIVMLTGLMISRGLAIEPMEAEALLTSCENAAEAHDAADRMACHAYIQGYLDAVERMTLSGGKETSFQQRALQTRARGQMIQEGAMVPSPYCFPDHLTLNEIVVKLIREEAEAGSYASGEELLSTVLKKHFTCPPR